MAAAAALAAYMLASSWAFTMFFLYLILLFPNQLLTWNRNWDAFLSRDTSSLLPETLKSRIFWPTPPWPLHLDMDWTSESRNIHSAPRSRSYWSCVSFFWRPGTEISGSSRPRKWIVSAEPEWSWTSYWWCWPSCRSPWVWWVWSWTAPSAGSSRVLWTPCSPEMWQCKKSSTTPSISTWSYFSSSQW